MIVQSGASALPCGNRTTHPPRMSFHRQYTPTTPDAIDVPIAAPTVPYAGIGPSPRMSTTLSAMLSSVIETPRTIGVRASPADRSAPPIMKNISMPLLNTNIVRRNGSASACTAGAAFTRSSNHGESTYPSGARMKSDIAIAVRNA